MYVVREQTIEKCGFVAVCSANVGAKTKHNLLDVNKKFYSLHSNCTSDLYLQINSLVTISEHWTSRTVTKQDRSSVKKFQPTN